MLYVDNKNPDQAEDMPTYKINEHCGVYQQWTVTAPSRAQLFKALLA